MKLTQKLKGWLTENLTVPETASDEEFKKAAALAMIEDKITASKLAELTEEEGPDAADVIGAAVAKAVAAEMDKRLPPKDDPLIGSRALGSAVESGLVRSSTEEPKGENASARAARLFAQADPNVRVKSPVERYSQVKGAIVYPKGDANGRAGMPVEYCGKVLESTSQADKAVIGATFKWLLNRPSNSGIGGRIPPSLTLTEHDEHLVKYAMHELPWTGMVNARRGEFEELPINGEKLSEFHRKVLLDDSTSGGTEAVPVVFDDAIITTPVLYGQLFPLVTVVPIARGRLINGASVGNVTITSGTAEGTSISAFNTASMIAAFDNTVYPAVAAIYLGNDLQEDSPVGLAQIIVQKIGEKCQEWLDNQIANGDGTTEPEGIFTTSGVTAIGNPAGGSGAAAQITDYENLYFGITLPYRRPSERSSVVFVGNDTTYKRARAIYVGSADARRLMGMDYGSYTLLGDVSYRVQNDISNAVCGCANLKHYRMYRRLGVNVRTETTGNELALKNLTLIVMRMRWAGKIELGGYVAKSSTWAP